MDNIKFKFNEHEVAFRDFGKWGLLMHRGNSFELEGVALGLLCRIKEAPHTCTSLASSLYQDVTIEKLVGIKEFVNQLYFHGLVLTVTEISSQVNATNSSSCSETIALDKLRCWSLARAKLIPLKCNFNLSHRCNQACLFCYNGKRPGTPGCPHESELKLHEIRDILHQIHDAGTFFLTLTGGEPFVRNDIDDILTISDELGFAVEVLTNGTLITPQVAAMLARHRIQIVIIPIFGAKAETHDAFVQLKGAFQRVCKAISTLVDAGCEVGVRCAINRANFQEWREMRSMVSNWGARYFPHVQVHRSCDKNLDMRDLRLNDKEIEELFEAGLVLNTNYRCNAGFARVEILPNGDVGLCSLLPGTLGSLRRKKFAEIWHGSKQLQRLRSHDKLNKQDYHCAADALYDDGELEQPSSESIRLLNLWNTNRTAI